ncbi:MAG: peptidoglycan DD-metalloendopeptidase family protein [Actinomycetia bacterium]|nr:peptidoglycan DD-metalloendopeptidase family protein [Actinomycetes bacterium]
MSRKQSPRWFSFVLSLALVVLVPVSASAQSQTDVDRAQRNKSVAEARQSEAFKAYRDATTQLDDAVHRYEILNAQHEDLLYRISRMEATVKRYESEADQLELTARDLLINAYTSGQSNLIGTAFNASNIQDLVTTSALRARAASADLAALDNLEAVSRQADRSSAELAIRRIDVAANQDEAEVVVDEITELQEQQESILAKADANLRTAIDNLNREMKEKKIEDERVKRQQAEKSSARPGAAGGAPVATTPGFVCPVQGGTSFIDSWGFARSGGRRHKGVDMFAPRNRPLQAVVDGRIKLSSNSLGGFTVHLYSDNGTVYYYAHLESQAAELRSGQRVTKGTVVGFVGNSGNARYTSTHVHFEIRPNGKAVNPYPTVRSAC